MAGGLGRCGGRVQDEGRELWGKTIQERDCGKREGGEEAGG